MQSSIEQYRDTSARMSILNAAFHVFHSPVEHRDVLLTNLVDFMNETLTQLGDEVFAQQINILARLAYFSVRALDHPPGSEVADQELAKSTEVVAIAFAGASQAAQDAAVLAQKRDYLDFVKEFGNIHPLPVVITALSEAAVVGMDAMVAVHSGGLMENEWAVLGQVTALALSLV